MNCLHQISKTARAVIVGGAVAALFSAGAPVSAAPISITGYDIFHTSASGSGGWGNTYTGSVVSDGASRFNYTGGSGTMNNGVVESTEQTTQLLDNSGNISVVLHLGAMYSLNSLSIFGGDIHNLIPPELQGMTIGIGASSAVFSLASFGPDFGSGQVDHLATITGSALDGVVSDTITLSGFTGSPCCGPQFFPSIAEITLDGQNSVAVPEPLSMALVGLGLAAAGLSRRRSA